MTKLIVALILSCSFWACDTVNETPDLPFEAKVSFFEVFKDSVDGEYQFFIRWKKPFSQDTIAHYYIWINDSLHSEEVQGAVGYSDLKIAPSLFLDTITADSVVELPVDSFMVLNIDQLVKSRAQSVPDKRSMNITLWADFSTGADGEPVYATIEHRDSRKPRLAIPQVEVFSNKCVIAWNRPSDIYDVYRPKADTGMIFGYNIQLYALGAVNPEQSLETAILTLTRGGDTIPIPAFAQKISFLNNSLTVEPLTDILSYNPIEKLFFAIVDSAGYNKTNPEANRYTLTIEGLLPRSSYKLAEFKAYDISGNDATIDSLFFKLTDDSKPETIKGVAINFIGDSTAAEISWSIPQDWRDRRCNPFYADSLCDISYYDFQVYAVSPLDSTELRVLDNYVGFAYSNFKSYYENLSYLSEIVDSINLNAQVNLDAARFVDTLRNIVPGRQLKISIVAVDTTAHKSDTVYIRAPLFVVSDGDGVCPEGMVAVTSTSATEFVPALYCMEQYEHRDDSGVVAQVTADEASAFCDNMGVSSGRTDLEFSLCSERQWYRACAGADTDNPRLYGALSNEISYLEDHCNIGTDVPQSIEQRDEECMTSEGVRDLPGQYQEWVTLADSSRYPAVDSLHLSYGIKGAGYKLMSGLANIDLKYEYATCENLALPAQEVQSFIIDTIVYFRNVTYSLQSVDSLFGATVNLVQDSGALQFPVNALTLQDSTMLDSLGLLTAVDDVGLYVGEANDSLLLPLQYDQNKSVRDTILLYTTEQYLKKAELKGFNKGVRKMYNASLYRQPYLSFRCCATPKP